MTEPVTETETEPETIQRIVLLNSLVSRSVSRSSQEYGDPPIHGGAELLEIIEQNWASKVSIEFFNSDDDDDDNLRIKSNKGKNSIRIVDMSFEQTESSIFCTMLVDYIDSSVKSFPVVDFEKFEGRELSGTDSERGATAAHVVIKLPIAGYEDGKYNCVIEAAPNVTRSNIEYLLCRQLRRRAKVEDWTHEVAVKDKSGKNVVKRFKYHPKLQLMADVGRSSTGVLGSVLSRVVFTKRSEKITPGQPTAVIHEDLYADMRLDISAKQGPTGKGPLKDWVNALRNHYETRGFKTKLFFRNATGGGEFSGNINPKIDGATDLIMCHREVIEYSGEAMQWASKIQPQIRDKMKELLNRDELWKRAN